MAWTPKLGATVAPGGLVNGASLQAAASVAVGDTIQVAATFSVADGATGGVITDDLGNTYTRNPGATDTPNSQRIETYACIVTHAGTPTVQLQFEPSPGSTRAEYIELNVDPFSGSDASSALDGTGAAQYQAAPTTGTDALSSGAWATSNDGCLIYTATLDSATGGNPGTPGTGFTGLTTGGSLGLKTAWRVQPSAGSVAGTWTAAASTGHVTAANAVAPASTGGGDAELTLGAGALALEGHAPSLAVTGDVSLTLGSGALVVAGYAPRVDDGTVEVVTGLDFPGSPEGNTAADFLLLGWANGDGGSGIDTATPPPPIHPMTLIWRAFPRGPQKFYSGLFYAQDWPNNVWDPGAYDYYGFHPYNNADIIGPGGPRWEISVGGDDETEYQNGDPAAVDFGNYPPSAPSDEGWYTQVATVRVVEGDYEYTFYPLWPDTSTSATIRASALSKGQPSHPILCIGDAPWNRGKEIYWGVLRGFQFYDEFLSLSDIASEIAAPGSTRTPWYLNLNPTPDDISDKSGQGHDPAWVNSNRPTLWAESVPVDLTLGAGALALEGHAPSLDVTADVALTLGAGALALEGAAPSLAITADVALTLGAGALALTGRAPTLEITAEVALTLGAGAAQLDGYAPTLQTTADVDLTLGTGAVQLAGHAPSVDAGADVALTLGVGAAMLAGAAPSLDVTADVALTLGKPAREGDLLLLGFAPSVAVSGDVALVLGAGALVVTGYAPSVDDGNLPVYQRSPTRFTPIGGATRFTPRGGATRFTPLLD